MRESKMYRVVRVCMSIAQAYSNMRTRIKYMRFMRKLNNANKHIRINRVCAMNYAKLLFK